ncbi:MAG: hypothetical protein H5U18_04680 [Rhodobacteraceae bacterium]|nr:hypothetical protein [Paracoccaceae bacterium]
MPDAALRGRAWSRSSPKSQCRQVVRTTPGDPGDRLAGSGDDPALIVAVAEIGQEEAADDIRGQHVLALIVGAGERDPHFPVRRRDKDEETAHRSAILHGRARNPGRFPLDSRRAGGEATAVAPVTQSPRAARAVRQIGDN